MHTYEVQEYYWLINVQNIFWEIAQFDALLDDDHG